MEWKCLYCGGQVVANVEVGAKVDQFQIGLYYQNKVVKHLEPLLADLCIECGSVTRMFVKDPTKKWLLLNDQDSSVETG